MTSVTTVLGHRVSFVLYESLAKDTVKTVSKRGIQREEVKRNRINTDYIPGLALDTSINRPLYTTRYLVIRMGRCHIVFTSI